MSFNHNQIKLVINTDLSWDLQKPWLTFTTRRLTKRAPSGRNSRTKPVEKGDSDEETSTKNFSDATRAIASLSKRCGGYRTIHVGHLRSHICIDQKETVTRRINDAVGILNRARAIAERATEILIDCICSSNQDTHLLLQLTHGGKGGATYWQNLLRMIVNGTIGARVGSEHRPILDRMQALWGVSFLRNLSWPDTDIRTLMLSVLIYKVAADIDTVFSNQIVGMPPLLKERVVEVVGEEGKQAIEEIEAWVDESLEDDPSSPPPPVQVFYKINRLLPAPYRWSLVPHTSFGGGSFQNTVREVADVDAKATRAAFMKNSTKGRLLDEVFLLPPEMLAKSRYVLHDSPRRYVRTPSFKASGLVLSLLWIDTTSKPSPPDRKMEDAISLPNIFSNKSLQSTHKDAWIIALESGATRIVGAVAYDPNQRRNLAVTTKCLAEPERRYRDWLEVDKPEAICTAERECTKSDQETWAVFLRRFVRSYEIARTYYSYLKPPSKDKNTPMKRKADEGGTSRAGPSKSRKTH
ncbi:hypothetical protein SeLEV6574_g05361 [Synchytrium endobioticum]|uniref:Uncharacterized protein n=1 Tax=Synchytrium endobioticum TaxID=286115 RepID=A0A507CUN6_9FUNG|nr:hypothetical protein SeLEV6574_g05361 [Synchytrium endobioticum]